MLKQKKINGKIKSDTSWKREPVGEATSLNIELSAEGEECPDCTLKRANIALCMMECVVCNNNDSDYPMNATQCAKLAVEYADALIAQLSE